MIPGNSSSQGKYVDPPTSVSTSAGNAQATVSFTLPVYDGKGVATYVATSSPSGITGSGASSPITVTGLSNGTAYTFTVTTISGYGVSATSSASNSVTPVAPPPPPPPPPPPTTTTTAAPTTTTTTTTAAPTTTTTTTTAAPTTTTTTTTTAAPPPPPNPCLGSPAAGTVIDSFCIENYTVPVYSDGCHGQTNGDGSLVYGSCGFPCPGGGALGQCAECGGAPFGYFCLYDGCGHFLGCDD